MYALEIPLGKELPGEDIFIVVFVKTSTNYMLLKMYMPVKQLVIKKPGVKGIPPLSSFSWAKSLREG